MKLWSKSGKKFFAVVVFAHLIFFLLALHFKRIYMGDSYEYVFLALNIKEQFLFYASNSNWSIQTRYFTLRPPGYSLFLLLVYFFTVQNWLVIVLQNILSVCNILYFRNTLQKTGYNKRYDWIFLIFLIAYPAQFIYANTIAPDLLLQTCVLIYIRHFILLEQQRKTKHALLMSAALTYAIFTKPILYWFVPLHIVIIIWVCARMRVAKIALLTTLIPVACIMLYNLWNMHRTGKFHFTSLQPWNAMYYNVRLYQEHKIGRQKAKEFMEQEQKKWDETQTFKEWYEYGNTRSLEFLKEHFFSYLVFHTSRSLQFFIHPGRGEIDLFTGKLTYGKFYRKDKNKRIWQILKETPTEKLPGFLIANLSVPAMFLILAFNMLKCIGAAIFFLNKKIKWWYRLFAFILLAYFAFMTGPLANTRYHLPVSLLFIGCSVSGFQWLLQWKENRRIITP